MSGVLAGFLYRISLMVSYGFRVFLIGVLFSVFCFVVLWFFRFRFLSSDVADVLIKRKGGFMVFKVHPFSWGCVGVLRLGEYRAFSSDIVSRGLSLDELFIHNFVAVLSNTVSLPVNVSIVIRKVGSSISRFIIVSSRGLFLRRLIRRVKVAVSTLSSYFSSLGFQLDYPEYGEIESVLRKGVVLIPKVSLVIDSPSYRYVKIDSTVLMAIRNLVTNSATDYTLILKYGRFPKTDKSSQNLDIEEDNDGIEWRKYGFGIYFYYDSLRLLRGGKLQSHLINNVLSSLLPVASIKKLKNKGKTVESSISQFLLWPENNIRLIFDSQDIERSKLWVFAGFLILMLGSIEEEVLPKTLLSDNLSRGDILIGYQLSGKVKVKPFYIDLEDLTRHILIVGPTGAGKTTLTKIIVKQLINKTDGPSVWVFDFHGEYSFLEEHGFIRITPGRPYLPMGLNIFDPGPEDLEVYSNFLSSLLSEVISGTGENFSPQMERIVTTSVHDVIFSRDRSKRNPLYFLYKINDVSEELSNEIPSAKYSLHAIFNRLNTLFSGIARNVFWVTKTNLDINNLLKKNVVFDLSYFSSKEPTKKALWILVNILLRYLYSNIIGSQELSLDKPKIFIVLEEARYVAPAIRKEETATMYAAEDLAVLGRKYGVSLCFITQTSNTISRDIIDNCGTIFMMGEAPMEIIKNLFTHNETRYLQIMPPKEALVKITTKSVLTHIKLLDFQEITKLENQTSKTEEHTKNYIKTNYKPINEPYENYIRRLITRDVSINEITIREKD